MIGKHSQLAKSTNPSSFFHTITPSKPPSQTSELRWCNQPCKKTHNNLEEKISIVIIRKAKILLRSWALKPKKTTSRARVSERINILA